MEAYLKLISSLDETVFGVSLMKIGIRTKSDSSVGVRKRSDIDIMANILSAANNGTKKTHIMYRCNLSHRQLQVYLQLLLEMGFLTSHSKELTKPSFRTTSKGQKFLDAYRTLKSLMS